MAAQVADPDSLWNWLRDTLALRASLPSLSTGEFIDLEGPTQVFSFVRRLGDEWILAVNNLTDAEQTLTVQVPDGCVGVPAVLRASDAVEVEALDQVTITLPAFGFAWLGSRG